MNNAYTAIRRTAILACLMLLALTTGCFGTRVNEYEHCIETRNGAIINPKMSQGWNWQLIADANCVPLTEQNYPAKDDDKETPEAERIDNAITKDSLKLEAIDIAVVWKNNPATIVETFKQKRNQAGNVNDAVLFEVQNAIRDGVRAAVATQSTEDLIGPNRASFSDSVLKQVNAALGGRAAVTKVFVRGIHLPASITESRLRINKQRADLQEAQNKMAIAEAEAARQIAEARGVAEANRLQSQSYVSNPKMLDLEIAKALAGLCGQATTCVIGASPNALLGVK